MIILFGIVVIETLLLGLTAWSARGMPARSRARFARYTEDLPHAL
jgi:hypothetical protein